MRGFISPFLVFISMAGLLWMPVSLIETGKVQRGVTAQVSMTEHLTDVLAVAAFFVFMIWRAK